MSQQGYTSFGQISHGNQPCGSLCSSGLEYINLNTLLNEEGLDGDFFDRCQVLSDNETFDILKDYYYEITIQPQSEVTSFNLLLNDKNQNTQGYQFLGTKLLPSSVLNNNSISVILFYANNIPVVKQIKRISAGEFEGSTSLSDEYAYYIENVGKYYSSEKKEITPEVIETLPIKTSIQNPSGDSSNSIVFSGIFRPLAKGFNTIQLQIARETKDLYTESKIIVNGETKTVKGRVLKANIVIYELKNLLTDSEFLGEKNISSLSRIGVWGNPGLKMGINGEEIEIGPSGLYEQDALPITSLSFGIPLATSNKDFIIDYQYNVNK